VREILRVAQGTDLISFAGGLPASELMPAEALSEAIARVLRERPHLALQYGASQGVGELQAWVADTLLPQWGLRARPEDV